MSKAKDQIPEQGELRQLALDELRPDHSNPRFPPDRQGSFDRDDEAVFRYIDREFDSFHVADSIRRHGYFLAEPLIAMPAEDSDGWTVLEGNRRLAALKGLADKERRKDYPDRRWRELTGSVKLPERYPVYVVAERSQVAPVLGFRHITGIAPWEPYAQARYVAQLVDDEGHDLDSVAELIGRSPTEVRSYYRNYWLAEQARELEIEDVDRVLQEFGVWTRAMGSPALRDYIGAPAPRNVDPGYWPINDDKKAEFERLITWLFGGPRDQEGRQKDRPAITDSRQITRLARVVENERGRATLLRGAELETAERALQDPDRAFADRLEEARDALLEALSARPDELDASAATLLVECLDLIEQLRERDSAPT